MYDVWNVYFIGNRYSLGELLESTDDLPRKLVPEGDEVVGVFVQDAMSGEYVKGEWISDQHEQNFLRGRRGR